MTAIPGINQLPVRAIKNELARRSLLRFTLETFPDYEVNWHHKLVCEKLDLFAEGKIKYMAIYMPPQHGKSELSSRRFPCYMLGKNPNLRIAIGSYNLDFARKFNKSCQKIIDSDRYQEIFPKTRLNSSNVSVKNKNNWLRNSKEFEIVEAQGSLLAAGIGTELTGNPVDILIVDDLYKDISDAKSPKIQKNVREWWHGSALSRLHAESQILLVITRWDEDDLPGHIARMATGAMKKGKPYRKFEIIKMQAIREKDSVDGDPRKIGEALWENRHPLSDLLILQDEDPAIFQALWQQDPGASKEFRIWNSFHKIKKMPNMDFDTFFGLDFGYNNPTAVVECQHGKGKGYVKEVLYKSGLTAEEIGHRIKPTVVRKIKIMVGGKEKEITKRFRVYCDPASPGDIKTLRKMGIDAWPAARFPNCVLTQIHFVKKLKMHYIGGDVNIEFELKNHQWKPGYDGKPSNEEIDRHNHATKAIMYGFYTHLSRPKARMGSI